MGSVGPVLRVDGNVRVSRVGYRAGERFISPSVQREQIRGWAKARPAALLEVWEELDESGGRGDRPLLETAVERIEKGLSQGLVVASVDRFGRSLVHGLGLIERIERAGGAFFSVRDGFDLTTDTGRLVLRIMLAMAEWQLDRTRAGWEVATARAVARGGWVASHVPIGYRKLRSGRLRLDPATAQFVSELSERRAHGATLRSLARFLEANEVCTSYGNPGWHNATIRNVLTNRVYRGEVRWGPHVREGAHEALTDEATWQAAQLPKRTANAGRENPALLAGLVRCASCGRSMVAAVQGGAGRVSHGCHRITAAGICPGPANISATPLELCVEYVVLDLLSRRRGAPRGALDQAEVAVREAQAALAHYRDSDRILGVLGERAYADGLAVRVQRVRDAALELATARTRLAAHQLPPASQLEADWPDLDRQARREIIVQVIDCVFVYPGKRNYDKRIWICPIGTEPRGLPRRGAGTSTMRTWQPRRGWISARYTTGRPPRWTTARLERELRAFTAGRTTWPAPQQFLTAGRSRLYRQVQLRGGDRHWANQLELLPHRPRAIHWTDEKIRDALTDYLKDKTPGQRTASSKPTTRQTCAPRSPTAAAYTYGHSNSACTATTPASAARSPTGPKPASANN